MFAFENYKKYFYYATFYFWQLSYRFLIVQIFQASIFVSIIEKKLIKLVRNCKEMYISKVRVISSPTLIYRHWDSDERVAKQNYGYTGDHRFAQSRYIFRNRQSRGGLHKVLGNDAEDGRCRQVCRPSGRNERNCGVHLAMFVLARPFPRAIGDRVDVVT